MHRSGLSGANETCVWDKPKRSSCSRAEQVAALRATIDLRGEIVSAMSLRAAFAFHIHENGPLCNNISRASQLYCYCAPAPRETPIDIARVPFKHSGGVLPSIQFWCRVSYLLIEHFDNGRVRAHERRIFHHSHSKQRTRNGFMCVYDVCVRWIFGSCTNQRSPFCSVVDGCQIGESGFAQ